MQNKKKLYFAIFSLFAIIILFLFFLSRFGWFEKGRGYPVNLLLVNVLGPDEFKDAHIKGAKGVLSINAPLETFDLLMKDWDKKVATIVYCSNYFCTASGEAALQLLKNGFQEVYAYEAGIAEWYQRGFEIQGKGEKAYLKIEVKKPKEQKENVPLINSDELKKMIETATIA